MFITSDSEKMSKLVAVPVVGVLLLMAAVCPGLAAKEYRYKQDHSNAIERSSQQRSGQATRTFMVPNPGGAEQVNINSVAAHLPLQENSTPRSTERAGWKTAHCTQCKKLLLYHITGHTSAAARKYSPYNFKLCAQRCNLYD